MEFDHEFSVAAPIDAVWATISDVERVAPCVPNARVVGRAGPDSYAVEITAVAGPFEVTAQGVITLTERDDAARREVLHVLASDSDGDRLAEATLTIALSSEAGERTVGAVHTSLEVGGLAALISDAALDELAGQSLQAFARNLEELLRAAPAA